MKESALGHTSRNLAYQRGTGDRYDDSLKSTPAPYEQRRANDRLQRHKKRRSSRNARIEDELDCLDDQKYVGEARWSKQRQRNPRRRDIRKKFVDSSRKFAEAFRVESPQSATAMHLGSEENVFDRHYHEARRRDVRNKRIQNIWKNKMLMKKLHAEVYEEEYFKIFGTKPHDSAQASNDHF